MNRLIQYILSFFKKTTTITSQTPWYDVMKEITGTHEVSGSGDNPIIMQWPKYISDKYPEMKSYCNNYTHDVIPWCGLTVAYCMARAGIKPQFGNTDTDRFLWADSWKHFGVASEAKPGAIMVFTRNGGGHVSLYEGEGPDYYIIRGGNQSDQVNAEHISKNKLTAIRWPS